MKPENLILKGIKSPQTFRPMDILQAQEMLNQR